MKKFFIRASILVSLFSLLLVFTPFILRVSGLEEPAKDYLLKQIFSDSGQQLDLRHVNIGLGTLNIEDVSYVSGGEQTELLIENIRFDFNLLSFVKSSFKPQSAIEEIVISRPRLIFLNKAQKPDTLIPEVRRNDIIESLTRLPDIRHLRIVEGKIIFERGDGNFIALAQNLNGKLLKQDENYIINVAGNVFSTEDPNFELQVDLNRQQQTYTALTQIKEYNFKHSLLPHLTREVIIDGGSSNGYLKIAGSLSTLDSLKLDGNLEIKNARFSIEGETIDSLSSTIIFADKSIKIDSAAGRYHNTPFRLSALVEDIFRPEAKGRIIMNGFPVSSLSRFMNVELFNGSTVDVDMRYALSPEDFVLKSELFSESFSLYKQEFSEFRAHAVMDKKGIRLDTLSLAQYQIEIGGKAYYDFERSRLNIALNTLYQTDTHELLDRINYAINDVCLDLTLDLEKGFSRGSWNYSLAGLDTLLDMSGSISGDNVALSVNLDQSNIDGLEGRLTIADYLGRPNIRKAEIHNFPFQIFTSQPLLNDIFSSINTSAALSGTLNDLTGDVIIGRKSEADTIFTLHTSIKDLLGEVKKIDGSIRLANLKGDFEADISPGFLGSYFNFGNQLAGEFFLDINKTEQLQGKLNFNALRLYSALSSRYDNSDYRYQAELNGKIDISGTLDKPLIKGRLMGDRFVFNDVGYYQPLVDFHADHTRFVADSIVLFRNNQPIVDGNFSWSFLNSQIDGTLAGRDLDAASVQKTLGIDTAIVTGSANFNARLKGETDRPYFELSAELAEGELDGIAFDNLQITLNDEIRRDGSFTDFEDHRVIVQNFFMMEQGRYHLQAAGSFPLNTRDEIDLAVNFDGDILGMLHHWEPFFRDGASLSEISLQFKGTTDDIRLSAADVKLERGELWLRDVAPHITNIGGHISLKEGSNQVDINNLTAQVDDNVLVINTVRDLTTASGRKLEPWHFKGVDIDFGILALETSGDGVRLFIPGLMTEERGGQLHLSGKTENEKFYFAGPIKHPLAYGRLTLNDAHLTYPFITSGKPADKPSPAVQFLRNMDWDVLVKAGEDVTYVRDIPAYIDNVQAELSVDDASEGLTFRGVIDENTFTPQGGLVSTRGRLEYLDQNFKVDRFSIDFLRNRSYPEVSGRAWTSIRDSVGAVPKTIYLELYAIDPETGEERPSGNWEDFKFKLVSADPTIGETQEQVLGYLGYSVENIKEKATNVGGALTERYLIRPLLRPLERALERGLGMDLIRFNSSIARNLFVSSLSRQNEAIGAPSVYNPLLNSDVPYLFLMSSSEVTVGKYLTQDIYLTYTGQLVSIYEDTETGFDFNHSFGLEYRFFRNILLEFEYDREFMGYYNYLNERQYWEDFKVRLRHSFSF